MSPPLYPLRFQPVLKRYVWGGRRLGTVLGKPIGEESDYAESWEVADHPQGQSVVANGPLRGTTLHQLSSQRAAELYGRHAPQPRFPLIFKLLDANQDLSVQVHPDDATAATLDPPDLGKTEAWVILDAAPGSRIFAGLQFGFTRDSLAHEVARGRTEICLHSFEPRPGDCLYIPAGTVHALGAGLLVAEIQQASDTTWRLFDWNRVAADGQPRQLHVEQALGAIDYCVHTVRPQAPHATQRPHVERLVACPQFVLDRWKLDDSLAATATLGGDERFHIVYVLEGEVLLGAGAAMSSRASNSTTCDEVALLSLLAGQTVLLPASIGGVSVAAKSQATLLDMYLPL